MVKSVQTQQQRHINLANQVLSELRAADPQRLGRVTARGLFCGFVELDGVVPGYYAKALALHTARSVPGVTDVVDLIRVAPGAPNRNSWLGGR